MKRFAAALVVFALAASAAISSHLLVNYQIEELKKEAAATMQAAEDKDKPQAQASLDSLRRSWEKADTALHMFVVHREMSEIELTIRALDEYLAGGDWELFREGSVRLLEALEHMRHSQEISFGNVF
ncbi:MAG: DUF4363 family protein [Oscillospiraceae bacterium]|jgi:putative heme degradation protein|nr:DUF4363 family protein [Oscillospiraceae bacterium]